MNKEDLLNMILSYLKQKGMLSDLEKDILSTLDKYVERPFDRKGSEQKVLENNFRYPDIFTIISVSPGIQNKPFNESSDEEVHHNLYLQIEALWAKNIQEQNMKNPY